MGSPCMVMSYIPPHVPWHKEQAYRDLIGTEDMFKGELTIPYDHEYLMTNILSNAAWHKNIFDLA
jgi:hypothetical protein